MSEDVIEVVDMARKAVRAAHEEFRALYIAVDSSSIPLPLIIAGADLDKISTNLGVLAGSNSALSHELLSYLFETRVAPHVALSHAMVNDMNVVAGRLRSMRLSESTDPLADLDENQCRDVREMVKRYDTLVSSVLSRHTSYAQQLIQSLGLPDILQIFV
jgi:hypothetical protein